MATSPSESECLHPASIPVCGIALLSMHISEPGFRVFGSRDLQRHFHDEIAGSGPTTRGECKHPAGKVGSVCVVCGQVGEIGRYYHGFPRSRKPIKGETPGVPRSPQNSHQQVIKYKKIPPPIDGIATASLAWQPRPLGQRGGKMGVRVQGNLESTAHVRQYKWSKEGPGAKKRKRAGEY